jgi:hypothetical protein
MLSPQCYCVLGHPLIQLDQHKSVEEVPGAMHGRHRRSRHDLHPSDDADGFVALAVRLVASRGYATQKIDKNVSVQERLHHSVRAFSW